MPPTEYDAVLQDVSSHMSRSELLRRLSTHSSSTSSSCKRVPARITKQTSASNSPHHVQRRRTTASHTTRSYPRIPQDSPYQSREQRLRNYYSSREQMHFPRPMSWHPGCETMRTPGVQVPKNEPALGNTIAGLENLAVSGTPASSVQQSIQDAFAMGYGHPITGPTTMYEQSPAAVEGYGMLGTGPEPTYDSFPSYSVSDPPQYPYVSQAPLYDAYRSATYQLPQQWSQFGQNYAINYQSIQAMPEYVSMQAPATIARNIEAKPAPRISKKRSKELVGMGLYDDENRDFMSSLNSAVSPDPNRDSLGKGLKLEETWQPPNEDEEEEDDEAYSTDEAEDVEEAPLPILESTPADSKTAFYPTYGDLSNQSFFFNDDDEYTNDDQYANYLTFGQGLQESQPKPTPNPVMENYLWF